MKFQDIQEARYHGLHPIVLKIKEYVDNDININRANDFETIPAGEEQVVFQDLTKLYGEPEIQKNVIPEGTLPRWFAKSENHIYEFDAGYDDQPEYADAPYGLNLYSQMNPLKEARYHEDNHVVAWIKEFVKSCEISDRRTYRLISEKHAKYTEEAITREYGDQITVKEWPVTEWNIGHTEDRVIHLQVDFKNLEVEVSCLKWNY